MLLNCHTYYSLNYGVLSTEELLKEGQKHEHNTLVLTDINNTSACLDFVRLAPNYNIRPILGIDFRTGHQQDFIGIAINNEGFKELNSYLSEKLAGRESPHSFQNCFIVYPFSKELRFLDDNEYIGITDDQLRSLPLSPWSKHLHKLVILHPVSFRNQLGHNIHRLLRTIDKNTLLSKLPFEEQAPITETFVTVKDLNAHFEAYPQIIQNTKQLLKQCSIHFEYHTNKNKKHYTASSAADFELLRNEAFNGLKYRYSKPSPKVLHRLNHELETIRSLDFCSYFLINWNLIKYAQHKNYYYVGRGSGANSLVAYLLRITDVDPVELDLYFERFINPSRKSPPDFDLDFSWTDRDDITRYLFDTYSYKKTALQGTYITYKPKAISRELGKSFGIPPHEIDHIQANLGTPQRLDSLGQTVVKYTHLFQTKDIPSHISVHSSGILISEEPIHTYSATITPPKGYPTTQFSMLEAEDIGLHKFDILSQRGLGKIKDSLQIIKENQGIDVNIHQTKKIQVDPNVRQALKEGKAIGCFYIESPAMRMLLTKLKADDYKGLVAASSIIRPGVAKSGMMREFILRQQSESRRKQARDRSPELYDLLEETHGVMVYQEDVLKVAHLYAGLTLEDADVLRRGMSWKFRERNEFWRIKNKFFESCSKKGHSKSSTETIWEQIMSFANYAFAKGHSASYAVESFQALYLKVYFPLEYLVASINNGGGFYRAETYLHEAKMHGATIEPPCINTSEASSSITGKTIFLGLHRIKDIDIHSIAKIIEERHLNGHYNSIQEFINRTAIPLDQLRSIIKSGAFRSTNENLKHMLWKAYLLHNPEDVKKQLPRLFAPPQKEFILPNLEHSYIEQALHEIETLGFPLSSSPFDLVEDLSDPITLAKDLPNLIHKIVRIYGYHIHTKRTISGKSKESMFFGVFVDLEGNWIDSVHFPKAAKEHPYRGRGIYEITGKVTEEHGFIAIEAQKFLKLNQKNIDD